MVTDLWTDPVNDLNLSIRTLSALCASVDAFIHMHYIRTIYYLFLHNIALYILYNC